MPADRNIGNKFYAWSLPPQANLVSHSPATMEGKASTNYSCACAADKKLLLLTTKLSLLATAVRTGISRHSLCLRQSIEQVLVWPGLARCAPPHRCHALSTLCEASCSSVNFKLFQLSWTYANLARCSFVVLDNSSLPTLSIVSKITSLQLRLPVLVRKYVNTVFLFLPVHFVVLC